MRLSLSWGGPTPSPWLALGSALSAGAAVDAAADAGPDAGPDGRGREQTAERADAFDPSAALALVDWLGWAASDREVAQYVAKSRSPNGPFARALRPPERDRLRDVEMPSLYAVEATVDRVRWAEREHVVVQVREAIVYRNPADVPLRGVALRVFANGQDLRGRGVDIQGVWVGDRPAEYALDGTVLSVELPEPLPPDHDARILLSLVEDVPAFEPHVEASELDPPVDPERTGAFGRADGSVNLGYWLPIVTPVDRRGRFDIRPLRENTEHAMFDPALFHVVLNAPSALTVATTGVTVHRAVDADQATTIAVAALARDFAVQLAPSGAELSVDVGGTRLRVVYPANAPSMGQHLLEYGERALRVYSTRFGPLAEAEVDLVEAPIRTVVGRDYPGLTLVDVSHQGIPYHRNAANEWTVAHEIAHQWWSCDVASDPALSPWLDEALAAHSAAVYWVDRYGADALDARYQLDVIDRTRRLRDSGAPDLPANLPAWKYTLDQYAAIVYGRGAMFFDRVRAELGDPRYFGALGAYHGRFTGQFATADDLLGVLSASAQDPARIEALYTRWITEPHGYEDLLAAPP